MTNKKIYNIYIYIYNYICQSAPSSNYGNVFVQITEFAAYGSLEENLKKNEIEICQVSSFCKFAMQVANGMSYLANQNLVHRDLSARNILVFEPALVSTVFFLWEHNYFHMSKKVLERANIRDIIWSKKPRHRYTLIHMFLVLNYAFRVCVDLMGNLSY